jgi:two-component system, chemotaxis family, chemotaxis protein CheY
MKILVVDDSRAMRMIVRRTLKQAGYADAEVAEAEDGAQALAMIESYEPDLVLSDWNMPNMSGLELLERMRRRGDGRTFGFVTSEGSPNMRELAAESGANFLISKPYDSESFRETLHQILPEPSHG